MKTSKFLIISAAMVLFSSCGKDFSETIVGTWTLKSVEANADCEEEELQNITVDENGCTFEDGETVCVSIVLLENGVGSGIVSIDGDVETFPSTYTLNEDTEVVTLCDVNDCNNFSKVGDDLQLTDTEDGCTVVYTFEKN